MSSNYASSRRGGGQVNFSTFIQDLNVEVPSQGTSPVSDDWDKDLAMFTNTQFFDWEKASGAAEFQAATLHGPEPEKKPAAAAAVEPAPATSAVGDFNFDIQDDFNNFDFGTFATPAVPSFSDNIGSLQQLQSNQTAAYQSAQQSPYAVPPHAGVKRPSDAGHSRQYNLEDQSRLAAEEDKRRRNTAASARFRIKKKAREQALEKKEKELQDEVSQLKNRITHLETENKWLRGLVMEKTGSKESKFDPKLAAALKVLGKDSDSEDESKRAKSEDSEVEAK
ncbi:hypothetical protein BKA67DRAFT_663940 [Truncatella angustata]|uniref:BZIP domain-containing protein n=1 Tax=Truncatella angustata TaxID=152316 RepID=A0A9P8RMQ9_9PEZI|nr:uncharacterized protein BKA67DRAFT_663940 [Truncatella angustata]KAH6646075.1 hypothetical protein BKA67DRAFT_663940 [Truncatella angustata]